MPFVKSLEMLELIDFGGVMEGDLAFLSFQFFCFLVGPWTMDKTQRKNENLSLAVSEAWNEGLDLAFVWQKTTCLEFEVF